MSKSINRIKWTLGFLAFTQMTSLALADSGIKETLSPSIEQRKIAVCGADSLKNDTAGQFVKQPFGWFPGEAKALVDSQESMLAKVLLFQQAKHSIDVSTYIFSDDESSRAYIDELSKAVLRGVDVRFMIDAGGSMGEALKDGMGNNSYAHIRVLKLVEEVARAQGKKPGHVDVVVFHPMLRLETMIETIIERMDSSVAFMDETSMNWDRRSHDKIVLIDKDDLKHSMAIVGGRNIDNSYYGYPKVDDKTYEDMEVLMKDVPSNTSPYNLKTTLGKHFQDLFCSKGNRWLEVTPEMVSDTLKKIDERPSYNPAQGFLDWIENGVVKAYFGNQLALYKLLINGKNSEGRDLTNLYVSLRGKSGADFLSEGFAKASLKHGDEQENLKRHLEDVIVDPNEKFADALYNGNSIYYQIRRMVAGAKKSIDIVTPYIFLPKHERDCLKSWVMAVPGRKVRIISNSSATSDSALAMATFDGETAPELMREGAYACEDLKTKKVDSGIFRNADHRIEVYELGRLNNKTFKGRVLDHLGREVKLDAYYGKLHAKYGIIDGRYSFVGSDNLDERSRHLNSETTFFVDSAEVAKTLTQSFDHMIARSYLFTDPDLTAMRKRPETKKREMMMSIVEFLNKEFPELGFGN